MKLSSPPVTSGPMRTLIDDAFEQFGNAVDHYRHCDTQSHAICEKMKTASPPRQRKFIDTILESYADAADRVRRAAERVGDKCTALGITSGCLFRFAQRPMLASERDDKTDKAVVEVYKLAQLAADKADIPTPDAEMGGGVAEVHSVSPANAARLLGINRNGIPDKVRSGDLTQYPDGKIDLCGAALHAISKAKEAEKGTATPGTVKALKDRIGAARNSKSSNRVCRKCGPVFTKTDLLCPECFESTDRPPK